MVEKIIVHSIPNEEVLLSLYKFEFVERGVKILMPVIWVICQNRFEKASILVAEDNAYSQILIKKFLTKWNVGNLR